MSNQTTSMETAIRARFPMPSDIRRHASASNYDLYYGPMGAEHWREEDNDPNREDYDFCKSSQIFADWINDLPTVYYLPDFDEIVDSEPEGDWINPDTGEPCDSEEEGAYFSEPETYYEIDAKAIADAFGYKELYRHCR